MEFNMKKLAVAAVAFAIAGLTVSPASAKLRHHHRMHSMTSGSMPSGSRQGVQGGMGGNNAELKGNSATSAGGSNSLSNTNNPGGMGNNAGPPMK
jgi:hypothetical protein